jgi:putative addiction module component (TIGR02574 family)
MPYVLHILLYTADMERTAAQILSDALQLPPRARAEIAGTLLESLDETVDEDAEECWTAEIERRLSDVDAGRVELVSWADLQHRLQG